MNFLKFIYGIDSYCIFTSVKQGSAHQCKTFSILAF